ncbi:MAG: MFS transporter [Acidimicrobiia bacterium]|nr:MFS transporter [Acidimicrobiia bacterium]
MSEVHTGGTPEDVPSDLTRGDDPKYLRLLLVLLVSAALFDGYDGAILDIIGPGLLDTFALSEAGLAMVRFGIKLGAVLAFFVAQASDRVGRRRILVWSVLGFTVFTTLTAFSPNVWWFTLAQFFAEIFIGAEYAVSVTMISEEFPATTRGTALGKFSLTHAAGSILVPVLILAGIDQTPLEWRALYLVGVIPLLALTVLRRRMRETRMYTAREDGLLGDERPGIMDPWRHPWREHMAVLAVVTFLRSFPVFAATAWWIVYAQNEIGVPETISLLLIVGAYGLGIMGHYVAGRLIDSVGRKPVAITFMLLTWVFGTLLFQSRGVFWQALFVVLAVFFGLGVAPAMNAFYTELFPTRMRSTAASWARNAFEIPGLLLGPVLVGLLGDHSTGALGSLGDAETVLMVLLPVAAYFVWQYLPETRGIDLTELEQVRT